MVCNMRKCAMYQLDAIKYQWSFLCREQFNYISSLIWQVDKLAYKEQMASILLKLGRFEEAEKMYRALLLMNPDNYRY